MQRSLDAAEHAALVLAVIDGSREPGTDLNRILETAERAERSLILLSRADLPEKNNLSGLRFSSVTGEGLNDLEEEIRKLFPIPQVPAGEILTNARQADAVRRATDSMHAALEALVGGSTPDIILTETEAAMQALGELTGARVREDITNRIFSRFCVGK